MDHLIEIEDITKEIRVIEKDIEIIDTMISRVNSAVNAVGFDIEGNRFLLSDQTLKRAVNWFLSDISGLLYARLKSLKLKLLPPVSQFKCVHCGGALTLHVTASDDICILEDGKLSSMCEYDHDLEIIRCSQCNTPDHRYQVDWYNHQLEEC